MSVDIIRGYGFYFNKNDKSITAKFIKKHYETVKKIVEKTKEHNKNCSEPKYKIKHDFIDVFEKYAANPDFDETNKKIADEFEFIIDKYENNYCDGSGLIVLVNDVMRAETGINFTVEYGNGSYYNTAIMLADDSPFSLTGKERSLTENELKEIITPYMQEIGEDGEPEYCDIFY